MGVATGPSLQSCRFTPAIPDGVYDLRVIANGIPSHAFSFAYARPTKPRFIDVGVKLEFEYFGKLVAEGDPFNWIQQIINLEINQLRTDVKLLQNSVNRLNSLIQARELPEVGRDIAKRAGADQIAKERNVAGEASGSGDAKG